MSIKVMTYVWEYSSHKGGELLTLLAIADYAHDDGTHAYPSIKELADKTRMTNRNIQLVLKKLERSQELAIDKTAGPHGRHMFQVMMDGVKRFRGEKISPEKISGVKKVRGEKSSRQGVKSAAKIAAPLLAPPSPVPSPSLSPPVPDPSLDPSLPPSPPEGDDVCYSQAFRTFWGIYPKKRNKDGAWKVWKTKKLDRLCTLICTSVQEHQEHDEQWHRGYIPYPATFLNAGGWKDELPPTNGHAVSLAPEDDIFSPAFRRTP